MSAIARSESVSELGKNLGFDQTVVREAKDVCNENPSYDVCGTLIFFNNMKGLFQRGKITSDTCDVVKHLMKVGAQADANNYLTSTVERSKRNRGGEGGGKDVDVHDHMQSDALIASLLSKDAGEEVPSGGGGGSSSSERVSRRIDRRVAQITSDAELALQLSQQPPTPEPIAAGRSARSRGGAQELQPKKFLRVGGGTGGGRRWAAQQARGFGSGSSRFPGSESHPDGDRRRGGRNRRVPRRAAAAAGLAGRRQREASSRRFVSRQNHRGVAMGGDDGIDLDNYEQLLALDENRVKVPLGIESVSRFPVVKYSARGSEKEGSGACKTGDEDNNCPICMCDFEEGDELRILPCFHKFHTNCIDKWLCKESKVCPICRATLNGRS